MSVHSLRAIALALLTVLALAGCGGDAAPEQRPEAFAIEFRHANGTLPPPYHREWSVRADAESGRVEYVPDYPGEAVPTYEASFEPDPAALDALYRALRDAGLLEGELDEGDAPEGGAFDTATVELGGRTVEIPAYDGDGDPPLAELTDEVMALVPESTWQSFERRADAYAEREHGSSP